MLQVIGKPSSTHGRSGAGNARAKQVVTKKNKKSTSEDRLLPHSHHEETKAESVSPGFLARQWKSMSNISIVKKIKSPRRGHHTNTSSPGYKCEQDVDDDDVSIGDDFLLATPMKTTSKDNKDHLIISLEDQTADFWGSLGSLGGHSSWTSETSEVSFADDSNMFQAAASELMTELNNSHSLSSLIDGDSAPSISERDSSVAESSTKSFLTDGHSSWASDTSELTEDGTMLQSSNEVTTELNRSKSASMLDYSLPSIAECSISLEGEDAKKAPKKKKKKREQKKKTKKTKKNAGSEVVLKGSLHSEKKPKKKKLDATQKKGTVKVDKEQKIAQAAGPLDESLREFLDGSFNALQDSLSNNSVHEAATDNVNEIRQNFLLDDVQALKMDLLREHKAVKKEREMIACERERLEILLLQEQEESECLRSKLSSLENAVQDEKHTATADLVAAGERDKQKIREQRLQIRELENRLHRQQEAHKNSEAGLQEEIIELLLAKMAAKEEQLQTTCADMTAAMEEKDMLKGTVDNQKHIISMLMYQVSRLKKRESSKRSPRSKSTHRSTSQHKKVDLHASDSNICYSTEL